MSTLEYLMDGIIILRHFNFFLTTFCIMPRNRISHGIITAINVPMSQLYTMHVGMLYHICISYCRLCFLELVLCFLELICIMRLKFILFHFSVFFVVPVHISIYIIIFYIAVPVTISLTDLLFYVSVFVPIHAFV